MVPPERLLVVRTDHLSESTDCIAEFTQLETVAVHVNQGVNEDPLAVLPVGYVEALVETLCPTWKQFRD